MAADNGRPLPKFGEWDVNNPASAEGFTVIFNKARNEKKTNSANQGNDNPRSRQGQGPHRQPPPKKRWFCCG